VGFDRDRVRESRSRSSLVPLGLGSVFGVGIGNSNKPAKKKVAPAKIIRTGFGVQIALWLALGLTLAAGSIYLGWTVLGRPHIAAHEPQLPTDVFLDLLRISLTIVAGVGGIVALVVAYRKQRLGEAQHQREDSAARREDQKMYSERFSKASELLGSERSAMRLAGVYAMASLADDWKVGRQTCIDVLCAYLRMPHKPLNDPPLDKLAARHPRPFERQNWRSAILSDTSLKPSEEHQVRSTIVRVIVEHLQLDRDAPWFGHNFNLSGTVLDSPDFVDAHFEDCFLDFGDSLLYGKIDFTGSKFINTEVSFSSTIIAGVARSSCANSTALRWH
jgi:hypothetical protein